MIVFVVGAISNVRNCLNICHGRRGNYAELINSWIRVRISLNIKSVGRGFVAISYRRVRRKEKRLDIVKISSHDFYDQIV